MKSPDRRLQFDKRLKIKEPRGFKNAKSIAIFALMSAVMVGVERIHVDVKTRNADTMSKAGDPQNVRAGMFSLPEISFTVDGESTDEEIPESPASAEPHHEITLDPSPPLALPTLPCPLEYPICNVEYVNGFPICPPFDDACKNALVDFFGSYPKATATPNSATTSSGPSIFDPFNVMKKVSNEISSTLNKAKEKGKSLLGKYGDWTRRGRLTVETVNPKAKSADKTDHEDTKKNAEEPKKSQNNLSASLPLYLAAIADDRSEPLTPEQQQLLFSISKDLANEEFVKELIDATGLTCDDIIESTTRFVNEQLEDSTSELSQAAEKNKFMIMYMAMQLGMEKIPNSNMWQWAKVPESLVKKEVCKD